MTNSTTAGTTCRKIARFALTEAEEAAYQFELGNRLWAIDPENANRVEAMTANVNADFDIDEEIWEDVDPDDDADIEADEELADRMHDERIRDRENGF